MTSCTCRSCRAYSSHCMPHVQLLLLPSALWSGLLASQACNTSHPATGSTPRQGGGYCLKQAQLPQLLPKGQAVRLTEMPRACSAYLHEARTCTSTADIACCICG